MLVDSPYFPDELEALPGLLAGAGFEPDALVATHADYDHLLGRLAFPELALGMGEPSVVRLHQEPGAAQRELRDKDAELYVERDRPLALGHVQTLPVPGSIELGLRGAGAPPGRRPHPRRHGRDGALVRRAVRGRLPVERRDPDGRGRPRRLPRDARAAGAARRGGGDDRARPRRAPRRGTERSASSTRTWTTWTRWSAERSARSCPRAATRREQRKIHAENLRRFALASPRASPRRCAKSPRQPSRCSSRSSSPVPPRPPPPSPPRNRLDDRRYVESGSRGYVVGSEAGRFPASGWHIRGEMGGVWTPPLKLLDGIWFGIDGQWIGPATQVHVGLGLRADGPARARRGSRVQRTDFVPDGRRGALFGLTLRSTSGRQRPVVTVDAHSELMSAYPWGWTTPNATAFNQQDSATASGGRLVFSERARLGRASSARASSRSTTATGPGFRGPQEPPVICPSGRSRARRAATTARAARARAASCATSSTSRRAAARRSGSPSPARRPGPAAATSELDAALADPDGALAGKMASREQVASSTKVDLPGRPAARSRASSGASRTSPTRSRRRATCRSASPTRASSTRRRSGTVAARALVRRRLPRLPVAVRDRRRVHRVRRRRRGPVRRRSRTTCAALRDVSVMVNPTSAARSCTRSSPTAASTSAPTRRPGNTDETAKFPSARRAGVALDAATTRSCATRCTVRRARHALRRRAARRRRRRLARGPRQRRARRAWARRSSTTPSTRSAGCTTSPTSPTRKGDARHARVGARPGARARDARSRRPGGWPSVPGYADSLDDPGNVQDATSATGSA